MIVKILPPVAGFTGVNYNTRKIDSNKGELMKIKNFGPLQGLGQLRPKDYIHYLKAVSSVNRNVRLPQFHAVISAKGKAYDKVQLTEIAENWMKEMGYGEQPYLIVFHKDTGNNHVHVVTTRVGRDGKKISSAYEHLRAQRNMTRVLGYDFALRYQFSTRAQFFMILESRGFPGTDPNEQQISERTEAYALNKNHAAGIALLLLQHRHDRELPSLMKEKYDIELLFHAAEGKRPYGYSIIDHQARIVFKGSEVLPLRELLQETAATPETASGENKSEKVSEAASTDHGISVRPVSIADDVDDQQIHGMRRRRQKKARTNTR